MILWLGLAVGPNCLYDCGNFRPSLFPVALLSDIPRSHRYPAVLAQANGLKLEEKVQTFSRFGMLSANFND